MHIVAYVVAGLLAAIVLLFAFIGLLYLTRGTPVRRVRAPGDSDGPPAPRDPCFAETVELLTKTGLVDGHSVDVFTCGDELYPRLWEDLLADAVPPHPPAEQRRTVAPAVLVRQDEPMNRSWKVDLATLFQSLLEPEVVESPLASAAGAISEREAFSELSMDAAHEASLAISSPFHWEPKPAWINIPGHATPAFLNPANTRRFAARPKIPIRPLHKQAFYRRFFFYLRRWLSRDSSKTV